MKKLLLCAALTLAAHLPAKAFEGTVEYQLSGPGGQAGQTMSLSMKDGLIRTEAEGPRGRMGVAIMDTKASKMTILMPEKKQYMVQTLDPAKEAARKPKGKPSMIKTGKSETIAGYKADEWVIENGEQKSVLWGTTELGGFMGQLKGPHDRGLEIPAELRDKGFFPLRMMTPRGGKMEATSVKPGSLDDSLFTVPSDYTEMKGMQGMGGPGGAMSGDAGERMKKAMENMTPEQKAMMQKMMQKQRGGE